MPTGPTLSFSSSDLSSASDSSDDNSTSPTTPMETEKEDHDSANTDRASLGGTQPLHSQPGKHTHEQNNQQNPQTHPRTYNLTPLALANHPYGVTSFDCTRNMKWVLSGCQDGLLRIYDFMGSLRGDKMLTGAERGTSETTKAGVLESVVPITEYKKENNLFVPTSDTRVAIHSIAVHGDGVWCLVGSQNGAISLHTLRHDQGRVHAVLQGHEKPVSVVVVNPDERGCVSGGWDKVVNIWDLDTGANVRKLEGHIYYVTSASYQPISPHILLTTSQQGDSLIWDLRLHERTSEKLPVGCVHKLLPNQGVKPWARSSCWSISGNEIFIGRRSAAVEMYDLRMIREDDITGRSGICKTFKMPDNSGTVGFVKPMPNGKHLICASADNVRLYNIYQENETGDIIFDKRTPTDASKTNMDVEASTGTVDSTGDAVPFVILPGHSRAVISNIYIDETCRFMVTASGNRQLDESTNTFGLGFGEAVGMETGEMLFWTIDNIYG